jgi:1-phosphofructokinase
MAATVVVLAPSPLLTVTIEDRAGEPDIHVHPGGQGVWQARMLSSLGVRVVLCAGLGGEAGEVLEHLLPGKDVILKAIRTGARNGATCMTDARATAPWSPRRRADRWTGTSTTSSTSGP